MGLLRLVLAIAVLLTHAGGVLGYRIMPANVAVEAFFIISGFLMALVLTQRYDPRRGLWLFYSNRLLRLFPTYWTVLLGALLVYALLVPLGGNYYRLLADQVGRAEPWQGAALVLSTFLIVGQDAFLFLAQGPDGWVWSVRGLDPAIWPLNPLPPAWSISLELCFYALAPLLVRLRTRWLWLILAASLAARLLFYAMGLGFDPWSYRFFPLELAWFLAGMLAYRHRAALADLPLLGRHPVAIVLAATLVGHPAQAGLTRLGAGETLFPLLYLALLATALPALWRRTQGQARDAALGELSYPLYLVHWPVLVALDTLWPGHDLWANTGRALLGLAFSLLLAQALVTWLERPIAALRRRRQARGPTPGPVLRVRRGA